MSQKVKGRFKSIFGKKTSSGNLQGERQSSELVFGKEVLKEINSENSVLHRVRALKELGEILESKKVEENAIEALLITIADLLQQSTPTDGRHGAIQFLISLVSGQYEYLGGMLRSQFFRIVMNHQCDEDLHLRITLLKVLTNNGKDISYCEQIGGFLVTFMSEALFSINCVEFLRLLVNIVHYNSSFLDKDIICSLVEKTCDFCTNANGEQEIDSCLVLLDATVRYGGLPPEGLFPLIVMLCRTVNIEKFCQPSWKLMRNLLGTKIGHTAILIMCQILEDNNNILDIILLRGAVFFIGMSIWGSKRVSSLHFSPIHVLPSFKMSMQSNNPLVAHEISLSLQRLVKKFGTELEIITWDIILDIMEALLRLLQYSNAEETESLETIVHSLLTNIEQLYADNKFHGSSERFFSIIACCAKTRPEQSVVSLLSYYQDQINPSNDEWLDLFKTVLGSYFKNEFRTSIRIKVINLSASVFSLYKYKYEDEIIDLVLNDFITNSISTEKDKEVLVVISQLLSDIIYMCSSDKYPEILSVIEKLLNSASDESKKDNIQDIEIAIDALIKAFKEKLYEPYNNYIVNIFNILVHHIDRHYNFNVSAFTGGVIRKRIFTLLLSVRANENHFIGLVDHEEKVKYSVHAIFKPICAEVSGYGKVWLVDCDFQNAFEAVLKCLKNELDWMVLEYVLKNLTQQLQNKNLFVYCQCNMSKLCAALCTMVSDKMYLNKVFNCPPNMAISELRNLIFPILSVMATYHNCLLRDRQINLVKCLEFGLNTLCAHTCVSCLTICTLEMQHVMVKLLPQILVRLSQISATVVMSIPVLEFLSTLKETPSLYVNFVEEQYMSIFAMALSYTDSHKYGLYIVTLAHQVIADWFTRCRLSFRKGFVTLIAKALKSSLMNIESQNKVENGDEVTKFHEEMSDVCLDMMARYSFSMHLSEPKRSSLVDSLLLNGISQTWLVGNMLVTITTSMNRCVCPLMKRDHIEKENDVVEPNEKKDDFPDLSAEITKPVEKEVVQEQQHGAHEILTLPDVYPEPQNESEHFVTASSEILDDGVSCEEEGYEPTPLVAKLTQHLVEPSSASFHVFSPSEQLLFSRQASKVMMSEYIDDDDDDDSTDSEYYPDHIPEIHKNLESVEITDTTAVEPDTLSQKVKTLVSTDISNTVNEVNEVSTTEVSKKLFTKNLSEPYGNMSFVEKNRIVECQCSCSGWAEIYIRRPTGNVSWVMKLENKEDVGRTTLSELSILTASCSGKKTSKKLSNASNTSLHRRRFSTGSMEKYMKIMDDNQYPDILSLPNDTCVETSPLVQEKLPLTKSLSSPRGSTNRITSNHVEAISKSDHHLSKGQMRFTTGRPSPSHSENTKREMLCPNFVFLQLFYSPLGSCLDESPVLLEQNEVIERAVKILDRIPSHNTHKFGVLYVGKGQEQSEVEILSNEFGSSRYTDFISGLGDLMKLTECSTTGCFTGGMDRTGADGKFAYIWKDDTTQVAFHIATMMPNKDKDPRCVSKKLHIGNDFVSIIYDDSKHGYKFGTIKGQFNLAEVHVRPLEHSSNIVTVRKKWNSVGTHTNDAGVYVTQPYVISDDNLAMLTRQLAIHANMAAVTEQSSKKTTNAFASNWLERLKQIHRIKSKTEEVVDDGHNLTCDFTLYT